MSTTLNTVCLMAIMIEIAAAKWLVGSTVSGSGSIRRKALTQQEAGERFEALLAEIGQARARWGVPESARVVVAYEAGQEGFWLVRALRARGIEAEVIDPVSLQVDRRARRAKTDRLDLEALTRALWRYLTGDPTALRTVRVPDETAEDAREWQRERDRLMAERGACRDRIAKKLRTHGIWNLPRSWPSDLRGGTLRTFSGQPLGSMLQTALVMELERLEAAEAKLKALSDARLQLDTTTVKRAQALAQLRGIGPTGAWALALRLFWRQFGNRYQVGACVGLVGMPYDSGVQHQDQGISKVGDPKLRALLIELAWMWLRYQPDSTLTRWFIERTHGGGKRHKRVMIVAVARKLAIALWRYLEQGVIPAGARLKPQIA